MNINYNNIKCKLCDKDLKNRRSLGNHLARSHKPYDVYTYTLEFFYNNRTPLCACGCGKEVKWHKTLYKFNSVLTGHNESIFGTGKYKESEETKQKRIRNIRRAYKEKGKQINKQISDSLKKTFDCEEKRAHFSNLSKERWDDENYRARLSESHKKSWEENYEDRYNKVFTDEFRQKISLSNRKRDKKIKSKLEVEAFNHIKNSFDDAVSDYWVSIESKNKCFDVYIPRFNLLIELDGKYWHGKDRDRNFTKDQLKSMKNDLIKNRVVKQGYNLCRIILEDTCFNSVFNCIEDLYKLSYHVESDCCNYNKDGMFRFKDENDILIERDYLLMLNKKDDCDTESLYLDVLCDYFQEYVRSYGWFYPDTKDSLNDVILKLRNREIKLGSITSNGQTGNSYLKSRFKSFWNVDDGPVKSWNNKRIMTKVIKYRLGLNNSKDYVYTLKDGTKLTAKETFDITPKNIVRGFTVQRKGVSWFKPVVAYEIYKYLLNGIEEPVVWDPSMGFGARMLAFCSAFEKGSYVGNDPAKETFRDLQILKTEIEQSKLFSGNISINNSGSEKMKYFTNIGDLVFTSPPYFDTEKYFNEEGQCWRDYNTINDWKEKYLLQTFMNAYSFLKPDGKLCINISGNYKDIILDVAKKCNFSLVETLDLNLKSDHFNRKRNIIKKSEPIMIFKKLIQ